MRAASTEALAEHPGAGRRGISRRDRPDAGRESAAGSLANWHEEAVSTFFLSGVGGDPASTASGSQRSSGTAAARLPAKGRSVKASIWYRGELHGEAPGTKGCAGGHARFRHRGATMCIVTPPATRSACKGRCVTARRQSFTARTIWNAIRPGHRHRSSRCPSADNRAGAARRGVHCGGDTRGRRCGRCAPFPWPGRATRLAQRRRGPGRGRDNSRIVLIFASPAARAITTLSPRHARVVDTIRMSSHSLSP